MLLEETLQQRLGGGVHCARARVVCVCVCGCECVLQFAVAGWPCPFNTYSSSDLEVGGGGCRGACSDRGTWGGWTQCQHHQHWVQDGVCVQAQCVRAGPLGAHECTAAHQAKSSIQLTPPPPPAATPALTS